MAKMDGTNEIPKLWRTKAHTIAMLKTTIEFCEQSGDRHKFASPGQYHAFKFALKAVRKADKKIWGR